VKAHEAIYNFRKFDPKGSEELSGNSIFYRDDKGQVFHTYSTVGRGGEQFPGIYGFFDLLPKGREEYGPTHSLPDWASFKTRDIHNMQGRSNGGKRSRSAVAQRTSRWHHPTALSSGFENCQTTAL
jgi:hypothetical protein